MEIHAVFNVSLWVTNCGKSGSNVLPNASKDNDWLPPGWSLDQAVPPGPSVLHLTLQGADDVLSSKLPLYDPGIRGLLSVTTLEKVNVPQLSGLQVNNGNSLRIGFFQASDCSSRPLSNLISIRRNLSYIKMESPSEDKEWVSDLPRLNNYKDPNLDIQGMTINIYTCADSIPRLPNIFSTL
jgi:hypothetical protein